MVLQNHAPVHRNRCRERSCLHSEHFVFCKHCACASELLPRSLSPAFSALRLCATQRLCIKIDAKSALACILSTSVLRKPAPVHRNRCRERSRLHSEHPGLPCLPGLPGLLARPAWSPGMRFIFLRSCTCLFGCTDTTAASVSKATFEVTKQLPVPAALLTYSTSCRWNRREHASY